MKTISFVIPVYNEEKRLNKTFEALQELKLPHGLELEQVIFVNDGSKDNSKFKIQNSKLLYRKKLISYSKNRGKGYAVRQGMLASTSDYTLFFDADISTPLSEINKFMPLIKKGIDVIIGTRKNGKSTVINHQPYWRELLGRSFTGITQRMLNVKVTDFTCGFKAFSKEAKEAVFAKSRINGWGYDAEILSLAQKLNFSLMEKSVIWSNDPDTKVRIFTAIPRTLCDLALIKYYQTIDRLILNLSIIYGLLFTPKVPEAKKDNDK